ncbi:hypothetical protein JW998_09435 [candidate division KSB1 bacterium]|nr:hypothetical protein [candidate division KSB1 bacterium]
MLKLNATSCGFFSLSAILFCVLLADRALGQPECTAWGNMTGIRVDGQLMKFETSLCVIGEHLMQVTGTAKERQQPRYTLEDAKETIRTTLADIAFVEVIEARGEDEALVTVEVKAGVDSAMSGAFFCLELPAEDYSEAVIELIDSTASVLDPVPFFPGGRGRRFGSAVQASARGARIVAPKRRIEVTSDEQTEILVQRGNRFLGVQNARLYFGLMPGPVTAGQTAKKALTIKATGEIDRAPVHIRIDATKPGRVFDGIGGNFRLQNPAMDPPVIDYCLDHLRITWGRVEMPWSSWHAVESVDPVETARAGHLAPGVHAAMSMAQRLARMGIPVIVSAWSAPRWAIEGEPGFRAQNELRGNPLKAAKMKSIIKSLSSYLLYLKQAYGVEAAMFSFNESDLGINVRQTGEEHADLIKRLGAAMASQGLATKMLLGDNSDATTYEFITPGIEDPETHKYIGAISFHSWRGCDDWTLSIWAAAAAGLNVPLLVGEGSTDAAAHRYPQIFLQPTFALHEIDSYVRIGRICQVRSTLQWQLTSDYSILTGDGLYNSAGELRPTQRFWNLKQLSLTPFRSFHLPLTCDGADISCVAYGDIADDIYSVHLVNNGAARRITLEGLPARIKQLRMYITDHARGMAEGERVQVVDGAAQFALDATCFTSLITVKQ